MDDLAPRGRSAAWEVLVVGVAAATLAAAAAVPPLLGTAPAQPALPDPLQPADRIVERPSIIGTMPFSGPSTAQEIQQHCLATRVTNVTCVSRDLKALLLARGSGKAFGELENLTLLEPTLRPMGHALAHGLGRTALDGYGGPLAALRECPFVLASGCFHGVLQSYFDSLPSLTPGIVKQMCPPGDSSRQFQCRHGMGHGLQLYTNYDLPRSLAFCDPLEDWVAVNSCHGGAFMENLVGFMDSQSHTDAGGHDHDGPPRPPPVFWVNATDPHYPCNAIGESYQQACYEFQSSVALHMNGWDFQATAAMCREAPEAVRNPCFQSYGRDVGGYTQLDPEASSRLCGLGDPTQASYCIRGYAGDVVNDRSKPLDGVVACGKVHEPLREACFDQVGALARTMSGPEELRALCAEAPEPYRPACSKGAGLPS